MKPPPQHPLLASTSLDALHSVPTYVVISTGVLAGLIVVLVLLFLALKLKAFHRRRRNQSLSLDDLTDSSVRVTSNFVGEEPSSTVLDGAGSPDSENSKSPEKLGRSMSAQTTEHISSAARVNESSANNKDLPKRTRKNDAQDEVTISTPVSVSKDTANRRTKRGSQNSVKGATRSDSEDKPCVIVADPSHQHQRGDPFRCSKLYPPSSSDNKTVTDGWRYYDPTALHSYPRTVGTSVAANKGFHQGSSPLSSEESIAELQVESLNIPPSPAPMKGTSSSPERDKMMTRAGFDCNLFENNHYLGKGTSAAINTTLFQNLHSDCGSFLGLSSQGNNNNFIGPPKRVGSRTLDKSLKSRQTREFYRFVQSLHELGYSIPLNISPQSIRLSNANLLSSHTMKSVGDLSNEQYLREFWDLKFNRNYDNLNSRRSDVYLEDKTASKDRNSNFQREARGSPNEGSLGFNDDMCGIRNGKSSRCSSSSDVNALLDACIIPLALRRGRESAV
ncbi:hypothetical protein FHG87_016312 [Trinorchestia longiramus]|nr:hypothetical protein FHG87_016312 [Trinorchestia longiramus]